MACLKPNGVQYTCGDDCFVKCNFSCLARCKTMLYY